MLHRRQFMQAGFGSGVLATGGGARGFLGVFGLLLGPLQSLRADPLPHLQNLQKKDIYLLEKILPSAVGFTPAEELEADRRRAALQVDGMLSLLSEANRRDFQTLLSLLDCPLTRVVLGLWPSWDSARDEDIEAMLTRWSQSRFQILRFAYQSTVQILQFAWYSQPNAMRRVGYPGPPEVIRPYLARSQEEPHAGE